MRNARAFTFAELLIGVTVSAIIMTGVTVFVGSGIENSFKIRKGVEENAASADFDSAIGKMASFWGELLYSWAFDAPYGSGVVLKNAVRPSPLSVLATRSVTGVCDAYSGTTDLPGTGETLELFETYAPSWTKTVPGYFVDHSGHAIRDSASWTVLGTGTPGFAWGTWGPAVMTEIRHPSAMADLWGGRYLVADSGNDRVLLLEWGNATTLVGPESGIRHPHEIATDGVDVRIAGSNGIFGIIGNPLPNGSAFSGSFRTDAAFSFDSVKVVPGGGRIPPSAFWNYAFDFVPSWGSVSVVGNVATVSFSGSTQSYSTWATAKLWISWITPSAVPHGSYGLTVQYYLSATKKYERPLPYFTFGDGDPTTVQDNLYERTSGEFAYPTWLAFSGGEFVFGDLSDFKSIGLRAARSSDVRTTRLVKDFRTHVENGVLTVGYEEYVRYDCIWGNHVLRERIWKIPLR